MWHHNDKSSRVPVGANKETRYRGKAGFCGAGQQCLKNETSTQCLLCKWIISTWAEKHGRKTCMTIPFPGLDFMTATGWSWWCRNPCSGAGWLPWSTNFALSHQRHITLLWYAVLCQHVCYSSSSESLPLLAGVSLPSLLIKSSAFLVQLIPSSLSPPFHPPIRGPDFTYPPVDQ